MLAGNTEVGGALVDEVDRIAVSGSTATGRVNAGHVGERSIGATLELGGKASFNFAADFA